MSGKNYVKVTSVIIIIAAVAAIILYPIAGLLFGYATVDTGLTAGWLFVVICLLYTAAAILQLIAGVKGVKGCDKKEAAGDLKKWEMIMLVIAVLAGIVNFFNSILQGGSLMTGIISLLFAFVLPGLYIHGANLNAKA